MYKCHRFYFFYLGYNNKVFSTSLITNIFKTILIVILILSLRGLDIEIDNRFEKIGDPQAISLYENLLIDENGKQRLLPKKERVYVPINMEELIVNEKREMIAPDRINIYLKNVE